MPGPRKPHELASHPRWPLSPRCKCATPSVMGVTRLMEIAWCDIADTAAPVLTYIVTDTSFTVMSTVIVAAWLLPSCSKETSSSVFSLASIN